MYHQHHRPHAVVARARTSKCAGVTSGQGDVDEVARGACVKLILYVSCERVRPIRGLEEAQDERGM